MKINEFVGSRIKSIRKNRKLTQKELGEKVGVKHNTISSYENGTNEPEQDILFRLADVLNVSINDFFPYEENLVIKDHYNYKHFPAYVSAGLPNDLDGITEYETISISDEVMGKYAGRKDIYFIKVNGESMNKIIPHDSLVAIRPVSSIHDLKTGDIVVYRKDGEYAIKRLIIDGDKLIFKPESHDQTFYDDVIDLNNEQEISIKGKVVLYIVNLD